MGAGVATHASFFSGVGGLDLGLERAGWQTVSFSEIDPYASAVLAERWPGVPNLGDIVVLNDRAGLVEHGTGDAAGRRGGDGTDWASAALWTGGFPCQDLSVAGKRRGMVEGTRSNLAFAFLDLVERHRPPAVLLENVPGLLSSHRGRDMAALLGRLAELGYGVAYRILDARHFGVPQRRRRVFILGLRSEANDPSGRAAAERAAAVLSVGSRCPRHPATGHEAGEGVAEGAPDGTDIVGTVPAGLGHHGQSGTSAQAVTAGHVIASTLKRRDYKSVDEEGALNGHLVVPDDTTAVHTSIGRRSGPAGDEVRNLVGVRPSLDPRGVRAPDGLARGMDDRELVGTLRVGAQRNADGGPGDTVPIIVGTLLAPGPEGGRRDKIPQVVQAFVKAGRAQTSEDPESWKDGDVMPTLNAFDVGDTRTTAAIIGGIPSPSERVAGPSQSDDPLLPLGLDSHRYRCCGNGVVAPVSEWLGLRLLTVLA